MRLGGSLALPSRLAQWPIVHWGSLYRSFRSGPRRPFLWKASRAMNRPMMDPTFVPDLVEAKRRHIPFGQLIKRGAKWFWTWLLSNPLAIRKPGDEVVAWPLVKVAVRVVVFWSILLPIL